MSSLQLGRLLVGPPLTFGEPLGDPIQGQGGAVVGAPRTPYVYQVGVGTLAADGQTDTLAARMKIRRQLRGMMNNTVLKLGGFIYLFYSDDPEQNGWYIPDQSTLTDYSDSTGLATGLWQMAASNWDLAGRRRTHREARGVWMKDLRTGLYARDILGWIYSTDFSALNALALSVLPSGASSASDSVTGGVVAGAPLPAGRDGGTAQLIQGLTDLTAIAYERPEAQLLLSDVIAYDRRGANDAPPAGPGAAWEEAYGTDHAWNWLTAGQPADTPVLDNGLVRIRYDGTTSGGEPGFRVDTWSGSAYVEQGKMVFIRAGDSNGYDSTWVSAGLVEWTPDRAVLSVVLSEAADAFSRERIYITVERGQRGVKFECYPAPKASGAAADCWLVWSPNGPDSNDSIMFEPATSQPGAGTDQIWGSAASNLTSAAGTFSNTHGNFVSILRCQGGASTVGPFQTNLAVVQAGVTFSCANLSTLYGGSTQPAVLLVGSGGMGYLQAQVSFVATVSNQVKAGGTWTPGQASQYRLFGLTGTTWTDLGEYTGSGIGTGSATRVEAHLTQDRTRTGAIYGGVRDFGQSVLYDSRMLGSLVAR